MEGLDFFTLTIKQIEEPERKYSAIFSRNPGNPSINLWVFEQTYNASTLKNQFNYLITRLFTTFM